MEEITQIPSIYCALLVFCSDLTATKELEVVLSQCLGHPIHSSIGSDGNASFDLVETGYVQSWELNDVLDILFLKIDGKIEAIKQVIQKYTCKAYVDIAFHQYGTYPALNFYGEVMKKIIFLEAEIGIDPY